MSINVAGQCNVFDQSGCCPLDGVPVPEIDCGVQDCPSDSQCYRVGRTSRGLCCRVTQRIKDIYLLKMINRFKTVTYNTITIRLL